MGFDPDSAHGRLLQFLEIHLQVLFAELGQKPCIDSAVSFLYL